MSQPYPSSGQPAGPERPAAPAPVLAAVKLMYAGAAISAVNVIILLAYSGYLVGTRAAIRQARLSVPGMGSCSPGHCHAAEVYTVIALTIGFSLIPIAVWLWMARASGQGRNWARGWSTVLFGLATLELTDVTTGTGMNFGVTGPGPVFPALIWLVGAAAVWLLWRPASSAFFRPPGLVPVPPEPPRLPGRSPRSL